MRYMFPALLVGTSFVSPVAAQPEIGPEDSAATGGVKVDWNGVPELSAPGGWSIKPRGRVQIDAAGFDAPEMLETESGLGSDAEFRRAYLGVDGRLPGNLGFRIEADFAPSTVEFTDLFLTYKPADGVTFTLGHHKPFSGLEDMTSDLFTSMLERGAFNSAFNLGRRVGLSGTYDRGDWLVQSGIFSSGLRDIDLDETNAISFDSRVVYKPKIGDGQLHVGGSAHFREFNDSASSARYRARPFFHTTDVRLVDTGSLPTTGEQSFGAEMAYVQGPFHATMEGHRLTALRPGQDNPDFIGGYAELGMLLTEGDTTAYKGGTYDRIRPKSPLSKGGIGAVQVNVRYDRIDLNDSDITGGLQQAAGISAIWIPEDKIRFILNYGHLWISDAAIPAGDDVEYQVDALGIRGQFDF